MWGQLKGKTDRISIGIDVARPCTIHNIQSDIL